MKNTVEGAYPVQKANSKKRLIVLLGPPCSGKSLLARLIAEKNPDVYIIDEDWRDRLEGFPRRLISQDVKTFKLIIICSQLLENARPSINLFRRGRWVFTISLQRGSAGGVR